MGDKEIGEGGGGGMIERRAHVGFAQSSRGRVLRDERPRERDRP